mmetsp:Transcript_3842/g.12042  ORF Transcript_3842/g.12042 Transcript_3842/m.12042 type:complete len:330 (+) Transcript_3842:56-1045(+)|eukprot:CAMPEP_0182924090 /NCGR_PEP_ID=MMETSP0105_2-20130417/5836_1 /TAXON_ID=81532 ORGANISM="Acanthoeca-like sp., Strain 10tr" /NCGR_SAMPLE_ID=MMETSP0105_2 /ASSEMBLY_ACC=CAM_ASM_000205 /LENGTH=329 /DNA_ID=CAMNT_0025061845 /DNA_START=66 /DNA_END=1055 /DNA_ORIENTATION=-
MADVDANFDLSIKKKKKKKTRTLVALEDEVIPEGGAPQAEAAAPAVEAPVDDAEMFSKKKKKKKPRKAFDIDGAEAAAQAQADGEAGADVPVSPVDAVVEDAVKAVGDQIGTDFTFPARKRRKREKVPEEFAEFDLELNIKNQAEANAAPVAPVKEAAWATEDRDYHYSELLERVFDIMRAKNPDIDKDKVNRLVIKPPQVIRLGSKKSGFINFLEICKQMHREQNHMMAFLLAELGTSGTLDGTNTLVLKGRFQQKQMETVIRRYIKEYVTCHTCKSPNTILSKEKESRLYFLNCETCGAHKSVQNVTTIGGFSAVIGKRSRLRAKQA